MPFLTINGEQIFFIDNNPQGEHAVLLCHGAGGSSDHWRFQLQHLKGNLRILAVDLPGHGRSGGNSLSSIAEYREIIREVAHQLALPSFFLGGHSMGGAITLDYARTYPQELKGILLVATGAKLKVAPPILETYHMGEHFQELINYCYGKQATPELIAYGEKSYAQTPPHVFYADFTACNDFDIKDEVKNIEVPAQIIVGTDDLLTPPRYSHYLHERMPLAEIVLVDKAGHMVMEEEPREVNLALEALIKRVSGVN